MTAPQRGISRDRPVTANSAEHARPDSAAGFAGVSEADPYDIFGAAVALRQLSEWLPAAPSVVLDLSRPLPGPPLTYWDDRVSEVVTSAGHRAIVVARRQLDIDFGPYKYPVVVADARNLDWVRTSSVDAVVAEGGALSESVAAEDTLADFARILRPGGRVLASSVSLTSGLAQLAEQNRWPELADAPSADVMLVPDPDREGAYLRCFSPDDLRELFTGAGLEIDWIRSRSVLPAAAVRQTLLASAGAMKDLVSKELSLEDAHEGEAHGARLIVSGRKPR
jgi:hypothetical protein